MSVDRLDDDDIKPFAPDTPVPGETAARHDSGACDSQPTAAPEKSARAEIQAEYRAYAIDRGCERVRETEENVLTPAMRRIEADDQSRQLVGLEHRLKGRDRIEEKVSKAMSERGLTAQEAFALVKDAIRYTFCYSEDGYAEGVLADCERLKRAGFELVDRKNSWTHEEYKGINSRWRVPENGQLFEVQFHTQASFDAKQLTHPAYEKLRTGVPTKAEQRELEEFQRHVAARIPAPPGGAEIPDYRRRHDA